MVNLRAIQASILKLERRNVRECVEAYRLSMMRLFDAGRDLSERFQTQEWANLQNSIRRLGFERRFSKKSFSRKVQA